MPFITQGKTNLKYVLIVVILAAIVGGGILGYYYLWIAELETRLATLEVKLPEVKTPGIKPAEEITEEQIAGWKTYRNEKFGFEFQYPPTVDIQRKLEEDNYISVYFSWPTSTGMSLLNVDAEPDYDVIDHLITTCAADGPMGSLYCTRPDSSSVQHFENQHGIQYSLFYTKKFQTDNRVPPTIISLGDIGPFIYVPLAIEPEFIIFAPSDPLKKYPESYQDDILGILSTLKPIE